MVRGWGGFKISVLEFVSDASKRTILNMKSLFEAKNDFRRKSFVLDIRISNLYINIIKNLIHHNLTTITANYNLLMTSATISMPFSITSVGAAYENLRWPSPPGPKAVPGEHIVPAFAITNARSSDLMSCSYFGNA